MNQWPHKVLYATRAEINDAVRDPYWQALRQGMKGMSTPHKLMTLEMYRSFRSTEAFLIEGDGRYSSQVLDDEARVQIDNYINALKRGGQLDAELRVVR